MRKIKISIAGLGYVGLSNAVLLARRHEVVGVDTKEERVRSVNERKCYIADDALQRFLSDEGLSLSATTDSVSAYKNAEYIVIATPTDYSAGKIGLDTSSIESVLEEALAVNKNAVFVIRSTIPIGCTKALRRKYRCERILFSPEFLREGNSLNDSLYPSRIIVGCDLSSDEMRARGAEFLELLTSCALKENVKTMLMDADEAEAVKLFSNTYLALRVAFFNELDTFAETSGMNARDIIEGVCADPRISGHYNNPSFGYGGYCLPKDTRQLLSDYGSIPNDIIKAVVASNNTRKCFVTERILKSRPEKIGVYRITMKSGSDNYRNSSMLDIMKGLAEGGAQVVVYEPLVEGGSIYGIPTLNDLSRFKRECDLIITNRYDEALADVAQKIYTRDLFRQD